MTHLLLLRYLCIFISCSNYVFCLKSYGIKSSIFDEIIIEETDLMTSLLVYSVASITVQIRNLLKNTTDFIQIT